MFLASEATYHYSLQRFLEAPTVTFDVLSLTPLPNLFSPRAVVTFTTLLQLPRSLMFPNAFSRRISFEFSPDFTPLKETVLLRYIHLIACPI